jgi:hypothetical protein
MSSKQIQKAGDHSLNVQGENVAVVTGLTYQEVRQVALDVFKDNFYKLAGVADDTARKRAEQITDKFIKELGLRNPKGVGASSDPDFQYTLFTAQRGYACAGDEELGDILVDLLVDRTKEETRSLIRIVLNESIRVAAKLTPGQIDVLSLIFLLRYTKYLKMHNLDALREYLNKQIAPFIPTLPDSYASLQHLEFTGCCSISIGSISLEKILTENYAGLLSVGIPPDELTDILTEEPNTMQLVRPCLRNPAKLQVNCIDEETLKKKATDLGVRDDIVKKLLQLDRKHKLKGDDLWKELDRMEPLVSDFRKKWNHLGLEHVSLTSVGIAIGHANVRRVTGESSPLSIWIQ